MSRDEKPNEFRRYRQALAALYLGTIAAGFLLLVASVGKQLLFRPDIAVEGPVLSAEDPDPVMLLACNKQVKRLYDELGVVTTDLLGSPTRGEDRDLGHEWEAFGRRWVRKWHEVDARCRFGDLAGSMGVPYERMAEVHGDLRAMRLKYQSLLVRFDEDQAAELRRMKRALDLSRASFEELADQAGRPGREQPQ